MKFENNFGVQSKQYSQYRPRYPEAIYAYLASIAPGRSIVWDCGTGSGQAAVGLAQYFEQVYATDASAEQIAQAHSHPYVEYHVESAGQVALKATSVDLVTVAQAVHWFDFDEFYAEVKRVLKPNGVLAVWTYNLPQITTQIDEIVSEYYFHTLSGFWPHGVHYVEQHYKTIPFPFEEITPPLFEMETTWDFSQLMGFLESWSGTQRYLAKNGRNPLDDLGQRLLSEWKDENEKRPIRWQMHFRIGRKMDEV